MRSADNIKKLIKNTKIKTDPKTTKAVLNDLESQLDHAQGKHINASRQNMWRIIMKSKFAKLAVAAVFIITGLVSLLFLDNTVAPAYALQQSLEAMKDVGWMHAVPYSEVEGAETVFGETWFSAAHRIDAVKRGDGSAVITYFNKDESYSYNPSDGTITLSLASKAEISGRSNSYGELFDNIIDVLDDHVGTEITTMSEVQNGEKVIVIEVKVPKGEPIGSLGTEIYRFMIDDKTSLPTRMKLQGYKADGEFVEIFDIVFDYPSSGPMDIYQLGVPRTAKIIDKRPSIDVQSIIGNYKTARENDLSHYIALIPYTRTSNNGSEVTDEATIYYVDGNKFRREQLSLIYEMIGSQEKGSLDIGPEMGDSLGSMLEWWTNRENLSVRRAEMYDGKSTHRVTHNLNVTEFQNNSEINIKSRTRNRRSPNLLNMYTGGAQFLERISNDVTKEQTITLIENEYSKQNGLICLQRLEEDKRFPFMHRGRRYKRLCYIDQNRDYVCTRMEEYFIQDELWKKMYKDWERHLVENPNTDLEYTMLQVKDIELGQTEDGKWYPQKIENQTITQCENGRLQEDISTFTIYLETDREFPEGVFDSDAFSKYLE